VAIVVTVKLPQNLCVPASPEFLEAEAYFPDRLLAGYKARHPAASDAVDARANHLVQEVIKIFGVENYEQFKEGYKIYYGHGPKPHKPIPHPCPVLPDLPPSNTSVFPYTGRPVPDMRDDPTSNPDTLQQKYDRLSAEHEQLLKLVQFNAGYYALKQMTTERNQLKVDLTRFKTSYSELEMQHNALKTQFDSMYLDYQSLSRRHDSLSGRHDFLSHKHDA
jgi:hypothetical protein